MDQSFSGVVSGTFCAGFENAVKAPFRSTPIRSQTRYQSSPRVTGGWGEEGLPPHQRGNLPARLFFLLGGRWFGATGAALGLAFGAVLGLSPPPFLPTGFNSHARNLRTLFFAQFL